jgi:tetratricopeptide (TPR) repeat protein
MSRLLAGLALAATVTAAQADATFTPASLPPGEAKRSTETFRQREFQPGIATTIYLLSCLTELAGGNYAQAQRDCSQAILLRPDNPGGYKLRGEASLFQGQYTVALEDLDRAIALDPSDDESFAARGQTYRLTHAVRRAIADFDTAISLAPGKAQYWNGRCWIRAEANIELAKALEDCNQARALSPKFTAALDSRGLVFLRLKRYARAIRAYDEAIALQPAYPSALFGRGLAKLHLRRVASGQADIRNARRLDADVDAFYARMGITGRGLAMPPLRASKAPRPLPTPKPGNAYAAR